MTRQLRVEVGPHAPQLCVQTYDLTVAECEVLRGVVTNNWSDSTDYQLKRGCDAFLQGYQPPRVGERNGWVLIEFWTDDRSKIDAFVEHLNQRLAAEELLANAAR